MNRVPDPLNADERALAEALARDALPGPSPQLDARILAAARSATATTATRSSSRRPRPRWIAGMGIAATLVLAIGIAWRLRPLPPQHQAASEYAVSAVRVIEPPAQAASPPATADDVVYRQVQSQPVPEAPKSIPAERESAAARKQAPPEPPVVFDEPSPMDAPTPPPAPPAPAAVAAPQPIANGMAAPAASTMQAAPMQKQADSYDEAKNLDRIQVTGSRIPDSAPQAFSREASGMDAAAAADAAAEGGVSRAVLDEEPPATADSPQVQEAWLQRIRELLSDGETDAARNSLAEFRRRYPKYVLPEDLRRFVAP